MQTQRVDMVEQTGIVWVEARPATESVIEFGRKCGMTFKLIEGHEGLLTEPITDDKFAYFDISDAPDFPIPEKARQRLFLVGTHYPIQQIIIADDLRKPKEFRETAEAAGKVALTAAGILTLGVAVIATGLAYCLLYDPKLIVVVDGKWISIAEWL